MELNIQMPKQLFDIFGYLIAVLEDHSTKLKRVQENGNKISLKMKIRVIQVD